MPISRRSFLTQTAAVVAAGASLKHVDAAVDPSVIPDPPSAHKFAEGPFQPSWDSLSAYECPDWYRDAKFGIWAHWSAQCVPEQGDWYARSMYIETDNDYKFHCSHYGHPSEFGFKDIDNLWKAENWDPDHLMSLYKAAGAKYFMSLANHHDNFDNWDSKYHEWNSVKIGPKQDIIGRWAKAAKKAGLPFGVSVHAAHTWNWFEVAQGADTSGPMAGVPYDGKLTKADGVGKWWEGLDPQELYCQNHTPGGGLIWDWTPTSGGTKPDQAFIDKFYNRTIDLIDQHHPDLIYFDDTIMPLGTVSDIGFKIAAHHYNTNLKHHHGKVQAVMTTKGLTNNQMKHSLVWDIERGASHTLQPLAWQTDTCIGQWHYAKWVYDSHSYKTPEYIIHTLIDIVSKNGNLLLSVPVKGDGTIDSDEVAFLEALAKWMPIGGEAIFGTRPWVVYGDGPLAEADANQKAGEMFNENTKKIYTSADIRFTTKKHDLYAFVPAWPDNGQVMIKSLAAGSVLPVGKIEKIELLGTPGDLKWSRDANGLNITLPDQKPCDFAWAIKIHGAVI